MTEPIWLDERDARSLHDRLLALHSGAQGLRDDGLLTSALTRPKQHFVYAQTSDISNHPFIDGKSAPASSSESCSSN